MRLRNRAAILGALSVVLLLGPLVLASSASQAASLPICRAHAIRAVAGLQGATGSMMGSAKLTNLAGSPCIMGEHIGLRLVDGRGRTLLVQYKKENKAWLLSAADPQANVTAGYTRQGYVLRPHATADVLLWWLNWCGPVHYPFHADILLPAHGGAIRAHPGADPIGAPRCDAPRRPSVFHIGPVVKSLG